jgi:valyl-tRNA synthetase
MLTPIPEKYDFTQVEKHWIESWLKQGIYDWNPDIERAQTFAVDTPPPTVSGSLHVGSAFGYIQQDVIVRQRRMRGLNIFYPMGWDDNGLPTERRVQNIFHVRCNPHLPYQKDFVPKGEKKDHPQEVSRQNFIELCHQATKQDEEVFKSLWQHLGLSIDWSLEYATIDDHCGPQTAPGRPGLHQLRPAPLGRGLQDRGLPGRGGGQGAAGILS